MLASCFLNGLFPRLLLIVGRVEVNSMHSQLENNLTDKKNGVWLSLNRPEPLFNFIFLKLDLSTFLSVQSFKDISIMEKFSPGRQLLQIGKLHCQCHLINTWMWRYADSFVLKKVLMILKRKHIILVSALTGKKKKQKTL